MKGHSVYLTSNSGYCSRPRSYETGVQPTRMAHKDLMVLSSREVVTCGWTRLTYEHAIPWEFLE